MTTQRPSSKNNAFGCNTKPRTGGRLRSLFCLVATIAAAPSVAAAQSNETCNVMAYAPPPSGCHREMIEASGRQRPFDDMFPSAKKSAQRQWERQALTKYGERYKSWSNAVCTQVECVKGSIAGLRRCTFTGYACVFNPKPADGTDGTTLQLTEPEIRRLQRLLRRDGFRRVYVMGRWRELTVDGKWGPITRTAVAYWLEREGLDDANMTERELYNTIVSVVTGGRRRPRRPNWRPTDG